MGENRVWVVAGGVATETEEGQSNAKDSTKGVLGGIGLQREPWPPANGESAVRGHGNEQVRCVGWCVRR